MERIYIDVIAEITPDGDIFPKRLAFEDGTSFGIVRRLGRPVILADGDGAAFYRFICLVEGQALPAALYCDVHTRRWWI